MKGEKRRAKRENGGKKGGFEGVMSSIWCLAVFRGVLRSAFVLVFPFPISLPPLPLSLFFASNQYATRRAIGAFGIGGGEEGRSKREDQKGGNAGWGRL